ncbi:MAG TPA: arylsulfotransferase family protein [Solirubrobacteraceae bacterium]
MPGTPDASPATQISFLGGPGTKVLYVHAVGSLSGYHSGRLEAYSTGTGESFLPTRGFTPGETVAVNARVRVGKHEESVGTNFKIAREAVESTAPFPAHESDPAEIQSFHSAPSLKPSSVQVLTPAQPGAASGDFFLAPYQGTGAPGPMIVNGEGQLVWFHPLPKGEDSTNFHVQTYEGQQALTWWQGHVLKLGFGQGEDVIANSSYQKIATVKAGNGYKADLHEFRITPEGTAWIDAFDPIHMSLSADGGSSNGVLSDSVIEEVDIKTGLVMWEWHALGHIPLSNSHSKPSKSSYPWDAYHINSIDPGSEGNLLISSRNTWTLYDLMIHSGAFKWRFGNGAASSFKLGEGVKFFWQHDAEWQPGGLISLFDNGASPAMEKESSGLLLRPEESKRQVTLVKRFVNPNRTLLAASQGNVLNLKDGNWLLGYGELPDFTEYNAAGVVLFEASLGENTQDFRTYFGPWSGHPKQAPAIAVAAGSSGPVLYASWNGATEVASWKVLSGSSTSSLTPIASAPRSGFETTIPVSGASGYVEAQALSSSGKVLGTSAAAQVP